ncbi:hypothetical protein dsat_1904 [Alkalidesulfovibrio alkalitolerans DSM 16529]|uniref:Methyltransferase type 11 n=1 Tax=Alkalidesulfovibrio alkalitolerans DSM 16529 TaxID=1121439 RepID=S7UTA6_9BACT|nr:methyltransferase domain-containing protein [Alkalidesulfovibrio alkalitolerans]EPR35563.1 hypothetical protein dsat_1904 [Alkalidesulfovibrio alkalitolerans DSM 16529]
MRCRICGSPRLRLVKQGAGQGELRSDDFAITDARYGQTLPIYACDACGFLQCPDVEGLLRYYEGLQDPDYEKGRPQRTLQARMLLGRMLSIAGDSGQGKTLLDVGAGSGILVQAAREMGFDALGVEPSRWLQGIAASAEIPVICGTIDDLPGDALFDAIMAVDVVEHVDDPMGLLRACVSRLRPGGLLAVVTPDRGSVVARLMGWRWWHYRIAHVNYFNRVTLDMALRGAGLTPIQYTRPGWRFPLDYLLQRLGAYIPPRFIPVPGFARRITVPLNLLDSLMAVAMRRES